MNGLQGHDACLLADFEWVMGVDEAGRGALAGPVAAGACVIGRSFFQNQDALARTKEINDSKQLSEPQREAHLETIDFLKAEGLLDFSVALASVEEIASFNILGATRLAMQRAVEQIAERAVGWALPEASADGPLFTPSQRIKVIVDGRPLKSFSYAHEGLVKGDGRSLCIAMASIAAKVARDRELVRLGATFPDYGLEGHKGYGTRVHREAIRTHGATPCHRERFLRKILGSGDSRPRDTQV
jgi:ribonuclease HII